MKSKIKSKIKRIVIGILISILVLCAGFICYDRITINNQYYIGEKELYIPIFVYHNIVSDESQIAYDYMQTTKKTFEEQLTGLQTVGYHFINYNDLIEYKKGNKKIYKKSCLITFDDGYEGVYKNAYPIAKKYNIPFAMFIINKNMGNQGVITWEQAKEMKESGLVTIASHSVDHPEFTKISTKDACDNVNKSYNEIEEKLGKENTKIFTYPYGLYTTEQEEKLKEQGYIQNLTDNKINKSSNLNLYGLHRCYPLNDSIYKIMAKIIYRTIRYN